MDTGGVSSAISKDGEHIYVSKGEKIPYEDGFRICVGQEKSSSMQGFNQYL
jgi:hypothetical protein